MAEMSLFNNAECFGFLDSVHTLCETVKPGMKAIIFDTETSGLRNDTHVILSLSWQVVDAASWETEKAETCFFPFPEDPRKVALQAIAVNGLTPEFLEGRTVSREEGFSKFLEDLACADICVAHNAAFDIGFINAGVREEGMNLIEWPLIFDSMSTTVDICGLLNRYGGPKNPRLSELAQHLKVVSTDIHLHHSSGDVELTRRCVKQLVLQYH